MDRKEKALGITGLILLAFLWYTCINIVYKQGIKKGRDEVYQELLFQEAD